MVANGKQIDIQCKDAKGQYIVQIQRMDANGNLIPGCVDVLSYRDGRLQNAVTIGNTEHTFSRVQESLDQANKRGVTISQVSSQQSAPVAPPAAKSWVSYITGRREAVVAVDPSQTR